MQQSEFAWLVLRAGLAPSVHNIQPARWRLQGDGALLAADLSVGLGHGDPLGLDAGLSCGAALEAMVIALSDKGLAAHTTDLWAENDCHTVPSHRVAAHIRWSDGGMPDVLSGSLDTRFTHRGTFADGPVPPFDRGDAVLLTDPKDKAWLAARHDWAGLQIMRDAAFRAELLGWMRFNRSHPRYAHDGLGRDAIRLSAFTALAAKFALGPLWPLLDRLGLTPALTAEAAATQSAQVLACFHRPIDESPVTSGRAYLRMCLEATQHRMAGWPMAALSDHPLTRAEVCARYNIGPDRRLVQVIRFGLPGADPPPRARRPVAEVLL